MIAACSQRITGESEEKLKRLGGVLLLFSVVDWVVACFPLAGGF